MPPSMPSSSGSASCRIEWRPSRWLIAALLLIALGAAVAVLSTGLSPAVAWPLAASVLAAGLHGARRQSRMPHRVLVLRAGRATLDAADVTWEDLQWRGPLAVLRVRHGDGRVERLAWWPDTLAPPWRRELRLAAAACRAAPPGASMAP